MTLEERVTVLEEKVRGIDRDFWLNAGKLGAIQAAIYAISGEPDPILRPTLLEDLVDRNQATALAQPITDEQLGLLKLALEQMTAILQRGFERALVRPEFRQPPPRRKA